MCVLLSKLSFFFFPTAGTLPLVGSILPIDERLSAPHTAIGLWDSVYALIADEAVAGYIVERSHGVVCAPFFSYSWIK